MGALKALLHYVVKRCSFECTLIRDVLDMVQVKTLNTAKCSIYNRFQGSQNPCTF